MSAESFAEDKIHGEAVTARNPEGRKITGQAANARVLQDVQKNAASQDMYID